MVRTITTAGGHPGEDAGSLLTRPQLAARWQCSPGHLANLASAGRGPTYIKLGGSAVRYRVSDIEAYEAAHEVLSLESERTA